METDGFELIDKKYYIKLIEEIKYIENKINSILSTQKIYPNKSHIINSLNTITLNLSLFVDKEFLIFNRFKLNKKNLLLINKYELENIVIYLEKSDINYQIITNYTDSLNFIKNYVNILSQCDVIIVLDNKIKKKELVDEQREFIMFIHENNKYYYSLIDLFQFLTRYIVWNEIIIYNISYKISYLKSPIDDKIFMVYPTFLFKSKMKIFLMELKNYNSNKIYFNLVKSSILELLNNIIYDRIYKYNIKCIDNPNINEKDFYELNKKNLKIKSLITSIDDYADIDINKIIEIVNINNVPALFNFIIPQYLLNEYNNFNIMIEFLMDDNVMKDKNNQNYLSILKVFNLNEQKEYELQELISYIKNQKKLIEPIFERMIENINVIECNICYEPIHINKRIILKCCIKAICETCVIRSTYKESHNMVFPIETKLINGKCPFCNKLIQLERTLIKFKKTLTYNTNSFHKFSLIDIIENIINNISPKYEKLIKKQLKNTEIEITRTSITKKNNLCMIISYNYKVLDYIHNNTSIDSCIINITDLEKIPTNKIIYKLKSTLILVFINQNKKIFYEKLKLISSHSRAPNDYILLNFPNIDNIHTINMVLSLCSLSNIHIININ